MKTLRFDSKDGIFFDLSWLEDDTVLRKAVQDCLRLHGVQRKEILANRYQPDAQAAYKVSAEALQEILQIGGDIHGIAERREISNCVVFNAPNIADSLRHEEILLLRRQIFKRVSDIMDGIFRRENVETLDSGHFLYPPGGYMGWHTNSQSPGWRLYINYAAEPAKSFFRYRDPKTGDIVTSWDKHWNFRLFKINPEKPFWHAVYSETDRYSFGFRVRRDVRPGLAARAWKKLAYAAASPFVSKKGIGV